MAAPRRCAGGLNSAEWPRAYRIPLEIERTSLDFYATIRSLWRQKRLEELYNGKPPPPKYDELYQDPGKQ